MKVLMILVVLLVSGCNIDNPQPDSSIYDFVDNEELASNLIGWWERNEGNRKYYIQFHEFYDKAYTNRESFNYAVIDNKIYFDNTFIADITDIDNKNMVLTYEDNTICKYNKVYY